MPFYVTPLRAAPVVKHVHNFAAKQMNNHKWNKKACLSSGWNCHQMNFSNMLEEKKNQFGFTCLESRTVDKEPKAFGPCLLRWLWGLTGCVYAPLHPRVCLH